MQVYKEEGNALTATFEDDAVDQEFEVFAVPYEGQQITTQRFKMDEPSGVYKEPHEVLIDGVCATGFSETTILWAIPARYGLSTGDIFTR